MSAEEIAAIYAAGSAGKCIPAGADSDLTVDKSDSPDPVNVGNNITYTVTIDNNGPDSATGVTLTDTLPAGVAFVSAVSTQGTCNESSGTVTCDIGGMANGDTVTVTIVVTAPGTPGTITNTADVSCTSNDPEINNNTASEDTTVIPVLVCSISGTVRTPDKNIAGSPIAGVTMTLTGAAGATTTTNALGQYTFTGLANGSYTVTPTLGGYTFTPTSRNVTVSGANVGGQNFTGTPGATPAYSISGAVSTAGGSPIAGVMMTLTGAAGAITSTNALGNYTFFGLANGSYTVTPTLGGYTFTPTSRNVTVSGANVGGQNFTGTPTVTYSISGTASLSGGGPLAGATMTLTGAAGATTTTAADGTYTFTGLANGGYTVTPSLAGYTFTPTSRAVTVSGANVGGQDFTGTPTGGATYSISGTVVMLTSTGNIPIAGVTITLTGAAGATTTTNALGQYTFTGLANGNYTVTPSKAGLRFVPIRRNVTISGSNVTGQNFTGR